MNVDMVCAAVMDLQGQLLGSAFLVAPELALTASHVVSDHNSVFLQFMRRDPDRRWQPCCVQARVLSEHGDCAVLQTEIPIDDCPSLALTFDAPEPGASWASMGWPRDLRTALPIHVDGVFQGRTPMQGMPDLLQLTCLQTAANLDPAGLSGSPMVMNGKIIGLLVSALSKHEEHVGGVLYAIPATALEQVILQATTGQSQLYPVNLHGGTVEIDLYQVRIRPMQREDVVCIPLSTIRAVSSVTVPALISVHTTLTLTLIDGNEVGIGCDYGLELNQVIRRLPMYCLPGKPRTILRDPYCREHGGDGTLISLACTFDGPIIGYKPNQEDHNTRDTVRLSVQIEIHASTACVTALRAAYSAPRRFRAITSNAIFSAMALMMMVAILATPIAMMVGLVPAWGAAIIAFAIAWFVGEYFVQKLLERPSRLLVRHLLGAEIEQLRSDAIYKLRCMESDVEKFEFDLRIEQMAPRLKWPRTFGGWYGLTTTLFILIASTVNCTRGYQAATDVDLATHARIGVVTDIGMFILFGGVAIATAFTLLVGGLLSWLSKKDLIGWVGGIALFYVGAVALYAGKTERIQASVADHWSRSTACWAFDSPIAVEQGDILTWNLYRSRAYVQRSGYLHPGETHELKVKAKGDQTVDPLPFSLKPYQEIPVSYPVDADDPHELHGFCFSLDDAYDLSASATEFNILALTYTQLGQPPVNILDRVEAKSVTPTTSGSVERQSDGTFVVELATSLGRDLKGSQ